MRTLIISAITCLLMASCQTFETNETNGIGRYQMNDDGYVLDTKEGILYSRPVQYLGYGKRYNVVTGEKAELQYAHWSIYRSGTTEERVEEK